MKNFRRSSGVVSLICALVAALVGAHPMRGVAEEPADAQLVNLGESKPPLMPPFAISQSCTAVAKPGASSVATGNAMIDSGVKIAEEFLTDREIDELLGDVDSGENGCGLEGKIKISTKCGELFSQGSGIKAIPDDQEAACRMLDDSGKFSAAFSDQQEKALCLGACQERVDGAIKAEKACLDNQEQQLRDQLKQYSTQMDQFAKNVEQTLSLADGEFKERETLIKEAEMLLGGDKSTGKTGLLQAQANLKKMSAALPSLAKSVKREAELLKTRQANFKTYQKQLAVKRAVECFRSEPGTNSKMTCDGKRVSPYQYIQCHLNKKYMGRGKAKGNAPILAEKKAKFDKIMSELDAMVSASATPPAANGQQAAPGTTRKIYEIGDVQSSFGGQLSSLSKEVGVDISTLFNQQLARCYQAKYGEVTTEVLRPESELGMIAKDLADAQANFSVGGGQGGAQPVSAIITQNADEYREALSAVGFSVPVDTQACLRGSPETQANCMQALANAVQSSLSGAVSDTSGNALGAAAMILTGGVAPRVNFDREFKPGNARYSYVGSTLKCLGINDCVTKLQSKITADRKTYESRVQEKKKLVSETNSSLLSQAKSLGSNFKAQSAEMQKRVAALRQAMSANGYKVKAPKREREKRDAIQPGKRSDHQGREEQGLYAASDLEEEALHASGAPELLAELDAVTGGMEKAEKGDKIAEKMEIAKINLARMKQVEDSCGRTSKKNALKECIEFEKDRQKHMAEASEKTTQNMIPVLMAVKEPSDKALKDQLAALVKDVEATTGALNGIAKSDYSDIKVKCEALSKNQKKDLDETVKDVLTRTRQSGDLNEE